MYQYFFRRNSKNPIERKNGWIKKEIIFFAAKIDVNKKIKIQESEIADYKWLTYKQAEQKFINSELKRFGKVTPIVKKYLNILKKVSKLE